MAQNDRPEAGRYEVRVEKGAPRGDLYELEQRTRFHVIDRRSDQVVLTFEGLMEASLSTDGGGWGDASYSGVEEVLVAPGGTSVLVRHHDGREEEVPLP
ncbi:MAG: hypothetical protein P1V51_16320 [Deltaproteobacteria bacterium]|nr:hypothetical protein [Deltaproteobacteria bacterium]